MINSLKSLFFLVRLFGRGTQRKGAKFETNNMLKKYFSSVNIMKLSAKDF